jgi:2,3-bisphosphoglycerate-dependent phosphoglycerate mutase
MSIILVRHGETEGNAARILQRPEVPLNARGIRQAELLAERLATFEIAHVLCSDLTRARMTTAPLLVRTRGTVEESPLLQERDFGDLRGKPYAELAQDPFLPDFEPPNGESWTVFYERVATAFELISARRRVLRGDLLVVTHGLVCGALLHRHLRLTADLSAPLKFDNTSVTIFDAEPPHTVRLLNCTRHLDAELAAALDGGAA